ncbi:MAG: TetR/AcrR family transcriptional regulator [Myxococcota bacterium]
MATNTGPRRTPKRRASETIVASILDAAEGLLLESPLDALTTNKIAKRAGVSIGSLYQYFPNKQAIIAGITRRINDRIVAQLEEVLELPSSAEERVLAATRAFCSPRTGGPDLRRRLLVEVPRSWDHTAIERTERRVFELFTPVIAELFPNLSKNEQDECKLTLLFGVRGAVQGALLYQPELIENGKLGDIMAAMVRGLIHEARGS